MTAVQLKTHFALGILLLAGAGCSVRIDWKPPGGPPGVPGEPTPPPAAVPAPLPRPAAVQLPPVDTRLCTAVVILVDSSNSMLQEVKARGGKLQKQVIARRALERILESTRQKLEAKPDLDLELAIFQFNSSVEQILKMGRFDAGRATAAIGRIRASSGTAIGRALEAGYEAVHRTGCARKHILCITDGDNSSGPGPSQVARAYHDATHGEVALHFIAFDTEAKKFKFLEDLGGKVTSAADDDELEARLTEIYEKRILAEKPLDEKA